MHRTSYSLLIFFLVYQLLPVLSLTSILYCAWGLLYGIQRSLSHWSSHSLSLLSILSLSYDPLFSYYMSKIKLLTLILHPNLILPVIFPIPEIGNSLHLVALAKKCLIHLDPLSLIPSYLRNWVFAMARNALSDLVYNVLWLTTDCSFPCLNSSSYKAHGLNF